MAWSGFCDIRDFANRSFLKPREVFIGHEQFFITGQQPDPVS